MHVYVIGTIFYNKEVSLMQNFLNALPTVRGSKTFAQHSIGDGYQKIVAPVLKSLWRNYATVTMFNKMLHNVISIELAQHLQPSSTITRSHDQRFIPISTRVNAYHNSFLLPVIRMWNTLPIEVINIEISCICIFTHS